MCTVEDIFVCFLSFQLQPICKTRWRGCEAGSVFHQWGDYHNYSSLVFFKIAWNRPIHKYFHSLHYCGSTHWLWKRSWRKVSWIANKFVKFLKFLMHDKHSMQCIITCILYCQPFICAEASNLSGKGVLWQDFMVCKYSKLLSVEYLTASCCYDDSHEDLLSQCTC